MPQIYPCRQKKEVVKALAIFKQDKGKLAPASEPVNISPQQRTETQFYQQKQTKSELFAQLCRAGFFCEKPVFCQLVAKCRNLSKKEKNMNKMNAEQKPKSQKVKKTYAFSPRIAEMIDTHKYANSNSEIDFVSQAICNYCAEIDGAQNLDVLCDRMYKIISAEVDSQSNRLANILFKIAVEMAIQNNMLAAGYVNLTDQEMRWIRSNCLDKVRRSHGFISFEKALAEEKAAQ